MTIGDWDHRMLCSDGSCIGVIGPDGTCKVCGRVAPGWGDERRRGLLPVEPDGVEHEDDELAAAEPERELCSDGGCIGVIGSDGTCKACGRPSSSPRPAATDADHEDHDDEDREGEDDDEHDDDEHDDDEHDDEAGAEPAAQAGAHDDDLDDRALCPDGACIGVIGPDGRCKVCGTGGA